MQRAHCDLLFDRYSAVCVFLKEIFFTVVETTAVNYKISSWVIQ